MDFMMYMPKLDEDAILIHQRLLMIGSTNNFAYDSTLQAQNELLGMGKYIVGHLLNAWENPPSKGVSFSTSRFYNNLNRILITMIERGDLSIEQLSRYRRLITSEKF